MDLFSGAHPGFGPQPATVDIRVTARADFALGEPCELDLANAQSFNLTFGDSRSGHARIVRVSAQGAKCGTHGVTLSEMEVGQRGWVRLVGAVRLLLAGATPGDAISIGGAVPGAKVKGLVLTETDADGYAMVLWHGTVGFGQVAVTTGGNAPPVASIVPTPSSGAAPLRVTLDASGSTDDGAITKYEFDDGDGGGFVDNGIVSSVIKIYTAPGTYRVGVRVTDDGSPPLQDDAFATVLVTGTDGGGEHDDPTQGTVGGAVSIVAD